MPLPTPPRAGDDDDRPTLTRRHVSQPKKPNRDLLVWEERRKLGSAFLSKYEQSSGKSVGKTNKVTAGPHA